MAEIQGWHTRHLLENVGIVCGAVSGNLVILDLDGAAGYPAFAATFPHLAQTYSVATGGGVGKHVYFRVQELPESIKAMNTPIGHLELCAEGRQVVAPPSIHPITGKAYQVEVEADILQVETLADLSDWIAAFKVSWKKEQWQPPQHLPTGDATINPKLIDAIAGILHAQGFKQ
ncbi:MAG: bifunctional DNA primase/polymerase, partial [Chloroflexota bacterium]